MNLQRKPASGNLSSEPPRSQQGDRPGTPGTTDRDRLPYYWEQHPPHICRQIEAAALAWFDRATLRMKAEQRAECAARHEPQPQPDSAGDPGLCRDCPGAGDIACGMRDRCPSAVETAPMETPEDRRRRRHGERLARFIRDHGERLRTAILELIAEDIGELIGEEKP